MKFFLVLCCCLTGVVFASSIILNETSSLAQQKVTSTNNYSPQILFLHPQSKEELRIEKILYLKQLMKLKCLKKIFDSRRVKNRLRYLSPYRVNKPSEVLPFKNRQNQVIYFQKTNPSIVSVEPQRRVYFGNNRIIFSPYEEKYIERQANKLQQKKIPQLNTSKVILNLKSENEKKQSTKVVQTTPPVVNRHKSEENLIRENSRVLTENEGVSKANTSDSRTKISQAPRKFLTSTRSVDHLQHQTEPVQQYEVTESVREKIINDRYDPKNNESFKDGKTFLRKGPARITENLKPQNTNINFRKGISKVLSTLTGSFNSSTKKTKENSSDSSTHKGYILSSSNNLNGYSDTHLQTFNKKATENKTVMSPREQSKQLKITLPNYFEINNSSKEKSIKIPPMPENLNKVQTTMRVENFSSILTTTKITNIPADAFKTKNWSDSTGHSQQTTSVPELSTFSGFVRDFDVQKRITEELKPSTTTLLSSAVTDTTIKNLSTPEKAVTENENSSNFSDIFSKSETTTTEAYVNDKSLNSSDKIVKGSEVTESFRKIKVGKHFQEEGVTLPIFTEFTDLPLNVDLLTAFKKDQETALKNSRKMHFNQETMTTTMSNQVSDSKSLEQRRSDILIDENLEDYPLDDSGGSINYLKQLKQKNFENSTSDSIIQLIPFVINDLREKRISPEDIPILSQAFGKYWEAVLALTNNADLDMLPLLKMKDEKDLNSILRTFLPEDSHTMTTESKEIYRDNYMEYYYEDDYENLNEHQGKLGEKEKSARLRRDKKDSRFFEAVDGEQNLISKYKYEMVDVNMNIEDNTSMTTEVELA